ncbi:uncharacterized protein DS421_11g328930 [Arachis hypogaea]|nr:uncharacterized protein DS421_11g328930 [Arachis hypogaea]
MLLDDPIQGQSLAAAKQQPWPKTPLVEKIRAEVSGGLAARADVRRAPNLPSGATYPRVHPETPLETRHLILVARQTRAGAEPRTICSTRRFRVGCRIVQWPTVVLSAATKLSISSVVRETRGGSNTRTRGYTTRTYPVGTGLNPTRSGAGLKHGGVGFMASLTFASLFTPSGFRPSALLQLSKAVKDHILCSAAPPSQIVQSFAVAHEDTNPLHSSWSPHRYCSRSSCRRRSHFSPSLSSPTRLSDLRSLVCAHLVIPPSSVVVSLVTGKH